MTVVVSTVAGRSLFFAPHEAIARLAMRIAAETRSAL